MNEDGLSSIPLIPLKLDFFVPNDDWIIKDTKIVDRIICHPKTPHSMVLFSLPRIDS